MRRVPSLEIDARVVGGPPSVVLTSVDNASTELGSDLLEPLFRLGLMLGPLRPGRSKSTSQLVIEGDVRFLVGKVDIGRRRGMRALRDGFEQAVDRVARDLEHRPPAASTTDVPGRSSPTSVPRPTAGSAPELLEASRARANEGSRPPEEFVEVDAFIADVDSWLDVVEHGTHVTLTRQGRSVAGVVPWEWVRAHQEKLAWIETAYWSAWVDGRFDAERFVELVDGAITPPGGPTTQLRPEDDEVDGASDVAAD